MWSSYYGLNLSGGKLKDDYKIVLGKSYEGNELKETAKANNTKLFAGKNAIEDMLSYAKSGICVNGIGGIAGLLPTLSALKHCARVCLANKESLVAAGDIIAETSLK